MPRGDGTGPMGYGPMTGRGAGLCAGYAVPGFMNPVAGRGFGFGRGRGFGRGFGARNWAWAGQPAAAPAWGYGPAAAPYAPRQEADALRSQMEYLEGALGEMKQRLSELEKQETEKA